MNILIAIAVGLAVMGCAETRAIRGVQFGAITGVPGVEANRAADGMGLGALAFLPPAWAAAMTLHGAASYLLFSINPLALGAYLGASAIYGVIREP